MIKLKVNKEELQVLIEVLMTETSKERTEYLMEMKMVLSILDELQIKLEKKLLDLQSKANMFNATKKASFKLAYYQAWALMTLLNQTEVPGLYEYNIMLMQANFLHSKLV